MVAAYLDHNASTSFPEELISDLFPLLKRSFGSPSSLHGAGRQSRRLINESTEIVSKYIDCEEEFIYWTSGASEANSWVFHSIFEKALTENRKPAFLISPIEHESVLLSAKFLQNKGAHVSFLKVTRDGVVDLDDLSNQLSQNKFDLVSVMFANNETGVVQPVEAIVQQAKAKGVWTHIDCVQALGKVDISVKKLGATYTTFSGHKLGSPKGVGFLALQGEGRLLSPLIHGKQQKNVRGGTENAFGVAMFGRVLEAYLKGQVRFPAQAAEWRDRFEAELLHLFPDAVVHGKGVLRLPNTTYVGFSGIEGDGILVNLDLEGICASSGAACSSGSLDPSHVLMAMGCDKGLARSSVRFSSGVGSSWNDYAKVLEVLPGIVNRMRKAGN